MTRFFRAALLVVFAAAVILPFCSSFFLCAMPCCHRAPSPQSAVGAAMPSCPGSPTEGCAETLSSQTERNTATVSSPAPSVAKLALARTAAIVPQVAATEVRVDAPRVTAPAPLHVLNSVFRI